MSTSYSTSFDALANARDGANVAWQDDRTLEGWYATRFSYRVGNGADNIGALYSFGATASTERALGSIASDTVGDIHYGVRFINDTNAILNNITVRYTGEQWRDSGYQNQQTLRFTYQIGATDLLSGQWMAFTTLNFTGPSARGTATALDGNAPANRRVVSGTLTGLAIAPGQEIWLRWTDINDSPGADHGLALDDLLVSASTGDAAPAVTAVVPADQAMGVETDAAITVNFSESVSLSAQAIILQCPVSTTIPLTGLPAIGVSTVTVRPTIPLPPTTLCTVTVVAEEVVDQNGNRLVNPFRFSFTTGQTDKTLTVALNPIGGGNITGNGINCPNDCTEAYPGGTTVNVLATPKIGWGFTGWSGDCTNTTPTCTVTLSDNRAVTAHFATLYTLNVAKTGNGTITSAPAGIHCGADCSET